MKQFQPSVAFNIETSHLLCCKTNDWFHDAGFYMKRNTGPKWVNILGLDKLACNLNKAKQTERMIFPFLI